MKKNRKYLALMAVLLMLISLLAGCAASGTGTPKPAPGKDDTSAASFVPGENGTSQESSAPPAGQGAQSVAPDGQTQKERYVMVEITMKNGGVIKLELDREAAPLTVENFENLVNDEFYDGLTFHRVVAGFMIQGGCPDGTGMGGPGHSVKGEFASNGWNNPISHTRGVISMARSSNPDSAGSQFFICHGDADFLDGNYAAFGRVVEGMDVVDRIATAPVRGESPAEPEVMETVRVVED